MIFLKIKLVWHSSISFLAKVNLSLHVTQMAMLLKLQESANYIESPEREGCLDPTLQATF